MAPWKILQILSTSFRIQGQNEVIRRHKMKRTEQDAGNLKNTLNKDQALHAYLFLCPQTPRIPQDIWFFNLLKCCNQSNLIEIDSHLVDKELWTNVNWKRSMVFLQRKPHLWAPEHFQFFFFGRMDTTYRASSDIFKRGMKVFQSVMTS